MELPRWLRLGSKGRDVRALQRALRKAGVRSRDLAVTAFFDAEVDREVRAFQAAHGLEVDGVVGPVTFAALEPCYDAFGRHLVARVAERLAQPASTVRQRIVAGAHAAYEARHRIHYTQSAARMEGVRNAIRLPGLPTQEDCSSFATWCYWQADAPDPNGLGYNGFGFTGTQIANGVSGAEPRPGDLVFYGPGPVAITHVAVYVGNGRVVSHGQESGPSLCTIDYRSDRRQTRSYVP